jgi:signal transduction histidine kinase
MKYSFVPWIALGISLAVTTIVWVTILDLDSQSQELEFNSLIEKSAAQIEDQLKTHEQVLMGFQGLFLASYEVEPAEFTTFFKSQKIPDRFPDTQGIGYNEYVFGENEKNELVKRLAGYGLDYAINPEGTRSTYVPVVYLEPQDVMNKRALGYDIYSEDIRKQAIDQAIKTGKTTLTGKIILVQETSEDVQNGFLMLIPAYENDEKTGSAKLKGFVTAAFRINDFVEGVLDEHLFEYMEIKIYDGPPDPENLFFDSSNGNTMPEGNKFSKSLVIDFGGREWFLDFYGSIPQSDFDQSNWMIVPIIGYSMSFLLFFAFIFFSKNIQLTKKMAEREKIAVIGELSSRFAHDVRNPLSNIQMAVEMLQKKKDIVSNRSSEDKFQIITKNLDRISHQVNDVLDFVRTHQLEKKELSMLVCLSESVSTMYIPKNIKINLPNEDVSIYGDSSSLQIVCKNLILNAIQAIGKQEGNITIRFDEESKYTIMEIEDSGPGFPESKISEIFEPLITTKQKGIGLGLVSCKSIIENHGGTITAKNNPTTFTLRLPKK